jgi:hypothetical protein
MIPPLVVVIVVVIVIVIVVAVMCSVLSHQLYPRDSCTGNRFLEIYIPLDSMCVVLQEVYSKVLTPGQVAPTVSQQERIGPPRQSHVFARSEPCARRRLRA